MEGLFRLVHVFAYFTCMSVSAVCVCAPHACLVCQKRALDPQGTELQMAASSHVGAGNQTGVLCKSRKRSSLSGPVFIYV